MQLPGQGHRQVQLGDEGGRGAAPPGAPRSKVALRNALAREVALRHPNTDSALLTVALLSSAPPFACLRSRYQVNDPYAAHFVTGTIVEWLPVFTTGARCDILAASLAYCRTNKGLQVYAWVILENHFHAVLAAPNLPQLIADMKRHTAKRLLVQLEKEGASWLINQFAYFRRQDKAESTHQIWQEGFHPQAIHDDAMMEQKLEYLHCNPVKRGLVASPEHWRYSSAHEWLAGALPVFRCDAWR